MYSNRTRSGQRRLLSTRGVRDLREVLDQKRNEKECAQGQQQDQQPPPDPSFNYLKDPSREQNDWRNPKPNNKQYYRTKHFTQSWQNRPNFQQRPPQHQQQQHNQDIENPCNIKIEFSTSSGEHTYTLDENVKLPTIKHVPDRKVFTVRRNNYERQRGGRQRYNNNRKYNKPMKNDKSDNSLSVDELTTKSVGGASQDSTESEIVQQLENVCLNHDQEEVDEEEVADEGEEEEEVAVEEEIEGEDEGEVDKDKEHPLDRPEKGKEENVANNKDKEENVDTNKDNSK